MRVRNVELRFDYVATRFDDGVKYGVWTNRAPLNRGAGESGTFIGGVAHYSGEAAWYSTRDAGDAVLLRWYGPFRTRREATLFLYGIHRQLVSPAVFVSARYDSGLGNAIDRKVIKP
jgi:hypothetical protein